MSDTIAGFQAVEDIISDIKNNWEATYGATPEVQEAWLTKTQALSAKDYVIVDWVNEPIRAFGLHADNWYHQATLRITVSTGFTDTGASPDNRLDQLINGTVKEIKDSVRRSGYALVTPLNARNTSDVLGRKFSATIDLVMWKVF